MTNEEIEKRCDFLLDRYKELEEKIAKLYPPPYYYPPYPYYYSPCSQCWHKNCWNCPHANYKVTWQYTNVSNTAGQPINY